MLVGLLAAIALAPLYWLAVPARWRREAVVAGSLLGLTLYDVRLLPLLLCLTLALFAFVRAVENAEGPRARHALAAAGLAGLAAFFAWNKSAGGSLNTLPSQTGLVFLGISFLAIKAAGALVESARGGIGSVRYRDLLAWIVFLPTYPSGPMEELDHFRRQVPQFDGARISRGLERIVVGLLKALVGAQYLAAWSMPLVAAPQAHAPWELLLGLYACSLRVYFDFAGYSDIAIGLAAVYGYEIEENFDRPFLRRNLVQLWQHWHMTLTRWLRTYLFVPVSRRLMRRGADRSAIAAGQMAAMVFCGLWHGFGWNFVLWGGLHALCLAWVVTLCRDIGRIAPAPLVTWWRHGRIPNGLSVAITFNVFSLLILFAFTDVGSALRYLRRMMGL